MEKLQLFRHFVVYTLPFGMSSRQVPHVSICRYFEAPFCSHVVCNNIYIQMIHQLNLASEQQRRFPYVKD